MAGLGKKTFTAGDVLIAGDVNSYLMDQTVMNFATVAARSSAIPVPSTGMVSYVGDTGSESATGATIVNVPQIQAYTGAAWRNIDGMTLIAKATVGTGVSSVVMNNVFSADYENYKVIYTGGVASTTTTISMTLGAANTNYYNVLVYGSYNSTVLGIINNNNGTVWNYIGSGTTESIYAQAELFNPFLTHRTRMQTFHIQQPATGQAGGVNSGILNDNTSYTGFTFLTTGGTMTGGNVYVYGYRSA
jgi:hypothetical protein